ncbi:MAG: YabP/YqfC family sporulation protein [Clostridiales bacterium]|nr:YabP/YqfC family sporulation protein [Clostridiales bacterium]
MQNETVQSILTIEQQKRISMTGVSSVDGFSETVISLTVNGKKVTISGTHLKVLSFSQGSGNFSASGEVTSVKYGGAKGKALQKLFK